MSRYLEQSFSGNSNDFIHEVSGRTINAIEEVPNTPPHSRQENISCCGPSKSRYDPDVSSFTTVITPVTGLVGQSSGRKGEIVVRMRRKNKVVTFQWEPFTGALAESGVAFLTMSQGFNNVPPYSMTFPLVISYKGVGRSTSLVVDPNNVTPIMFYLNTDQSATDINVGDAFSINGGAVSWIVD